MLKAREVHVVRVPAVFYIPCNLVEPQKTENHREDTFLAIVPDKKEICLTFLAIVLR